MLQRVYLPQRDNLIWGCSESGINAYGTSVGPHNVLIEDNILWNSGPNMSIGGAASGNVVRNNLFVDPTTKNLAGSSSGAHSDVTDPKKALSPVERRYSKLVTETLGSSVNGEGTGELSLRFTNLCGSI